MLTDQSDSPRMAAVYRSDLMIPACTTHDALFTFSELDTDPNRFDAHGAVWGA